MEQHLSDQFPVCWFVFLNGRDTHTLHRFAVGTGKPTTIPANYIDQCPAILNHPEASVEDDLVLAEILLYRTLHNKLANFSLGDDHGEEDHCTELRTWENKWKRLLGLFPFSMCF